MSTNPAYQLYTVREDLRCLKCDHIGAIKYYGKYYPAGVGNLADEIDTYEDVRNKPYMSHAMGLGGTIPWKCTNCKNVGLYDFDGLEGYRKTFEVIEVS
jgi:hypothetical protein